MKLIQYDRIPRKYHLRWDSNQEAIIVDVHRDCLRFVKVISRDAPWIQNIIQTHDLDGLFDSFSSDLAGDFFGFNYALQKTRDSGDYLEFRVPLPRIKMPTHYACEHCAGTGESIDEWREGEKCLRCDGSKIQHTYDWRAAYAITSSLGLLFAILDVDEDTSAKEYQHATVSVIARHGQHGSGIDGYFGADFIDYVVSNQFELKHIIVKNVLEAMIAAETHMWGNGYTHARGTIRVDCDSSSIGLTVPGDACGINTGFYSRRPGEGREFSCHNVDSPLQSLTLLAGLASFVGQASFYIDTKLEKLVTA